MTRPHIWPSTSSRLLLAPSPDRVAHAFMRHPHALCHLPGKPSIRVILMVGSAAFASRELNAIHPRHIYVSSLKLIPYGMILNCPKLHQEPPQSTFRPNSEPLDFYIHPTRLNGRSLQPHSDKSCFAKSGCIHHPGTIPMSLTCRKPPIFLTITRSLACTLSAVDRSSAAAPPHSSAATADRLLSSITQAAK